MTFVAGPDPVAKRLAESIGLRNCRNATIRMAVDEVMTVTATTYVERDEAGRMIDVLKDMKYTLVRWIPLSERLPPKNVEVLIRGVYDSDPSVYVGHLHTTGWMVKSGREWGYSWSPTHWMPVPEVEV